MTQLTLKHLETMFRSLQSCCLHQPPWTPVDAETVLCSVQNQYGDSWKDSTPPGTDDYPSWKDGTDSASYTVARLRDGRYGLLAESEDYTGHGCQCQASAAVYDGLDELLRMGVDDDGAREAIRVRLEAAGD